MKNIASIEKDQFCPIRRFIFQMVISLHIATVTTNEMGWVLSTELRGEQTCSLHTHMHTLRVEQTCTCISMERRLGQNSSFLFDSKPQSMENNHCNNDVDHLRSIAFSLRSNAIVVTSTSTKID